MASLGWKGLSWLFYMNVKPKSEKNNFQEMFWAWCGVHQQDVITLHFLKSVRQG
jgi:hypothetical protein